MRNALLTLIAAGLFAGACGSAGAAVLYFDDFDGLSSTDLNGTAPDVRPGAETWTAQSRWKADGSKSANGHANAWLPFSPLPEREYILSLDVNPDISGSGDWFSVGFSTGSQTVNWHTDGGTQVYAWMLDREDDDRTDVVQTFLGPDTFSGGDYNIEPDVVGPVNLKVVLDTKPTNWTAEWFVDGTSIRGPVAYGVGLNPTGINYAGLGAWSSATGVVDNFRLTEVVPEPSTILIWSVLGLGVGLGMAQRRRRTARMRRPWSPEQRETIVGIIERGRHAPARSDWTEIDSPW